MTSPTNSLKLAIASDHGGFTLKEEVVRHIGEAHQDIQIIDMGTHTQDSVDYPVYADDLCKNVLSQEADLGVLICTTGIGMSIAANRYKGIQAALVTSPESAKKTKEHNNANVICLSSSDNSGDEAKQIVDSFLTSNFEGGRHQRRVNQMNTGLATTDPEIFTSIQAEISRQQNNIELIASENFASEAVREAQGSHLTNKYAEGYPGKRWYGGCEKVDEVETLAIERAKKIFGSKYANVQPHSGSQANTAVYFSVLEPGDKILTMDLSHGGHLTHGHPANFSGKLYEVKHYGVSESDGLIDYDELQKSAEEFQPKMITAGASAYPRIIDFERMSQIAKSVNAYLFVDMAHIAGLVAGGVHPSPVGHADFITTTTHKSLRGPRGGLILTENEDYAKKIDSLVFPGIQGGPLMHVIAAKAVCFHEALQPGFNEYQAQVVKNSQALASALQNNGWELFSGGTDNHLMLADVRPLGINGKIAQETLDHAGITVNKNSIPYDTESPFKGGGIRIGTPAVTTRGMKESEMEQIGNWIAKAIENRDNQDIIAQIKNEVIEVNRRFPLP